MKEQKRRERGRPRTGFKQRLDITLSQEAFDFLEWILEGSGNRSGFLEELIKAHPRYQEWQEKHHQR